MTACGGFRMFSLSMQHWQQGQLAFPETATHWLQQGPHTSSLQGKRIGWFNTSRQIEQVRLLCTPLYCGAKPCGWKEDGWISLIDWSMAPQSGSPPRRPQFLASFFFLPPDEREVKWLHTCNGQNIIVFL